jgi:hypothetical protein
VHKKVAEIVECRHKPAKKKRKTMVSSSESDGKDMAYAQSSSVFAKGLKEPLAFSLDTN